MSTQKLSKEIKIIIISSVVLFLIAISFLFISKVQNKDAGAHQPINNLTREFNHRSGPDYAKVKIVEFYDPECEACAGFYPYIKEAMKKYEGKIQLIVRYALYHGNSKLAAIATEAAGEQNKFWEYQELLFLNQHEWSHKQFPATEYFLKYAMYLKLDETKFKKDYEKEINFKNIKLDLEDGAKIGVNGTPTIFINETKLETINPSLFFQKIEEELQK